MWAEELHHGIKHQSLGRNLTGMLYSPSNTPVDSIATSLHPTLPAAHALYTYIIDTGHTGPQPG